MNVGSCKLQVRSDESSNEIGRDALEVEVKLTHGKIGGQKLSSTLLVLPTAFLSNAAFLKYDKL